ncbi:MAG: hypothetical protein HYS65_01875 [Betaproteobacteria bacterium]|nr:hypothetical protein [Betaproteobacteria bacterium]MBI2290976.1 hypothetical protein [Betaproteobacteria bacterium]MBI3053517.1 hypothetical protein [Betaproteobacteria bacterium]
MDAIVHAMLPYAGAARAAPCEQPSTEFAARDKAASLPLSYHPVPDIA